MQPQKNRKNPEKSDAALAARKNGLTSANKQAMAPEKNGCPYRLAGQHRLDFKNPRKKGGITGTIPVVNVLITPCAIALHGGEAGVL